MQGNSTKIRIEPQQRRITMRELAKLAGVSHPVVSAVLNENYSSVKVSEATRERVRQVMKENPYYRNAASVALSKNCTRHIGFLLSDTIADAWSNAMFSQVVCGVEAACHEEDYNLTIRRYNLSDIDSFVFPRGVGERSVDGLVLCGYVEAAVMKRFEEFGIPCVCAGDNVEEAGKIPTIANDLVDGLYQAVFYAASLGHTKIALCNEATRRAREAVVQLIERTVATPETSHCEIEKFEVPGGKGDYDDAGPLLEKWLSRQKKDRPTLIICTDQTAVAILCELSQRGLHCPQDVSLIAMCDSRLNVLSTPSLTAINYDMKEYGRIAAKLLLDHLVRNQPLGPEQSRLEPCTLSIRHSVGPVNR